ncbi:MAG TPA: hypothetical protein PLS53_13170 [Thermoanaerobaculaceae bacterium]|nr:hypothetical protein [Thermoanaerobaculaceae bacterium]
MTRQKLLKVSLILTMALGAIAATGVASAATGEGHRHRRHGQGHREQGILPFLPPLPPLPHIRIDLGDQSGWYGTHRRDRDWRQDQRHRGWRQDHSNRDWRQEQFDRGQQRHHRRGYRHDHDPAWQR